MRSSYVEDLAISYQNNDKRSEAECHGYYHTSNTEMEGKLYH